SRQRKELELVHAFPLRIVARLQAWYSAVPRLVCTESGEPDLPGIGVQQAQSDSVRTGGAGDDFSPEQSPVRIEGIEKSADAVIIELLGVVHVGIQSGNIILGSPPRHVVEGPGIR